MTNFSLCLFTLSLITLTFTLQAFQATSNEATIINVCNKTPHPTLCKTCLHSDPKSKTADVRGLASISITCGTRDANKLYTDTNDLYTNTKDPALHDLLDSCWWRFLVARDNIDGAGRVLRDKGSDPAKLAITRDVIPFIDFCSDLFKKNPKVVVPHKILDEMTVVSKDCRIILGILSNISRVIHGE
ncbi:Pectinesterase inhibitor domain - like 10 [Theobroma cacao]|nr:Pectinesterase inhibitor domain - like 10 [Theobroma cacao]